MSIWRDLKLVTSSPDSDFTPCGPAIAINKSPSQTEPIIKRLGRRATEGEYGLDELTDLRTRARVRLLELLYGGGSRSVPSILEPHCVESSHDPVRVYSFHFIQTCLLMFERVSNQLATN